MANFCTRCGIPLAIGNESDYCGQHGGPRSHPGETIRCRFCSEPILATAKKCKHCGEFLDRPPNQSASSSPAPSPPVTRVVVVESKRGGSLALKGLVLSIVLDLIGRTAIDKTSDNTSIATVMLVSFGIGALYIISNLRKWKRENNPVTSTGMAWMMAIILILGCVSGLGMLSMKTSDISSSNSVSNAIDPKDAVLGGVKLDFQWHKGGFDNIMIADFTLQNPTQYSFKDFEITCTHFAPSGTRIDSNRKTIYQEVEPHSTKQIHGVSMGFILTQVESSQCKLTDATILP